MRHILVLIFGLLVTTNATAQELPPTGDQGGQTFIYKNNPDKIRAIILSEGKLTPMKCTNFTTSEEVKNLPRKEYPPFYLPDYTTCFRWDASDEYESDSLDGKCVRMRTGVLDRMREIQKSGLSENILKYGTSHENVYAFYFIYAQDYRNFQKQKSSTWWEPSTWTPVMNILEYSC